MLELWLIRHGETAYNRAGRLQGQLDVPLNARGRQQAQLASAPLRAVSFDHYACSDLGRAAQTFRLLFPGVAPVFDARLREAHFGPLQGQTVAELPDSTRAELEAFLAGSCDAHPSGAESHAQLDARLHAWRQELPASGRVAVVTHGGAIRAFLRGHVDWPTGSLSVRNLSVTALAFEHHATQLLFSNCPARDAAAAYTRASERVARESYGHPHG